MKGFDVSCSSVGAEFLASFKGKSVLVKQVSLLLYPGASMAEPPNPEHATLDVQAKLHVLILSCLPGAKTRYDDLIVIHINQTLSIHLSGIFLPWHREFVWLYEKALWRRNADTMVHSRKLRPRGSHLQSTDGLIATGTGCS